MSDRIFGACGLLLAIVYGWATLQIQESFLSDAVGPKTFPMGVAVILGLSSLWIMLRPDPDPKWPALGRLVEILAAIVVMVLYAAFLDDGGFIIATTLATTYLTWRLGTPPIQSVFVGAATAIGIYVIFKLVLGLSLASGPFGF